VISPGATAVNIIAGNVAASAAGQSVDMLQDLKTGHILHVAPKAQFIAQCVGSLFGVVFSVATYKLLLAGSSSLYII